MRRSPLPPPRSVDRVAADEPPHRRSLEAPRAARPRLRRWFDPASGWFRRLERGVSHWLTRNFYPRVPGISLPYSLILDRQLTLSETRVELPELPPAFCGLRILLMTDIHAGPFVSPAAVRRCFARLLTVEPDLILIGGDLAMSRLEDLEPHGESFARLRAPLGVFAVLGNHDHYTGDPGRLGRMIEEWGIELLHNRSTSLELDGARLSIAGVDDLRCGEPDLDAALSGAGAPTILVSHNPDLFFEASRRGVALMLSGHTHAGQVRIPGLPVLVRQSRYRLDEGRYRAADSELIVSRGLGTVGIPLRLFCPPEAVLITLARRR